MNTAPQLPKFSHQFQGPPDPPERMDYAWLFVDGDVRQTRVVGRAVLRREGQEFPAASCVINGRVTIVPTDRLVAIPTPDPYHIPSETW